MLALLSPRLWIALALVGVLSFTHFTVYRKGRQDVRNEWQASIAEAEREARQIEQKRQRGVDDAVRLAAKRAAVVSADSARADDALRRLRDTIAARDLAEESAAAAAKRADTAEQLLIESADAYRELAQKADRHVNDVQTLMEAWPR